MREFLDFPEDYDPNRLNEMGEHLPVDRVFSLIGTNYTNYNLAQLAVEPGSDGLVQMDHAYVKGSSRAFVNRNHSSPLGIFNSEKGPEPGPQCCYQYFDPGSTRSGLSGPRRPH